MTSPLERARLVSERVQIRSVVLSKARVDSHIDPFNLPQGLEVTQRHRSGFDRPEAPDDRLDVYVDFEFHAHTGTSTRRSDALLFLTATFLIVYSVPNRNDIPEDAFVHFANLNGAYNAWPYWRELVQSVTGRAGLAGIMVPVYRPSNADLGTTSKSKRLRKAAP